MSSSLNSKPSIIDFCAGKEKMKGIQVTENKQAAMISLRDKIKRRNLAVEMANIGREEDGFSGP